MTYRHRITFALVGFFVWAQFAQAQMTSTSYQIRWDSVSTGGSDTGSSSSYLLRDTLESAQAGVSSSTSYRLDQGYRGGIYDRVITFDVYAQSGTSASATALSSTTVTFSTTGFAVGSFIALVQDVGINQVTAIGKISSLTGTSATVDAWKNSGSQPTIDGTDDYVFLLSGAAVDFGAISDNTAEAGIIAIDVTVDNSSGYIIQAYDDGDLRSNADSIDDVSDGSVSLGSEEYGARSSDASITSSTFDTADTAFTTSFQNVATESSLSYNSRNFLTLKVATTSGASSGVYAHTITFIASGTF